MTPDAFHAAALALPSASFAVKFGHRPTYCVVGRMFAMAGSVGDTAPLYAFKTSDMAFEQLVESGVAIPAPYLARAKWVRLVAPDALDESDLTAYLALAHKLVVARLPARDRKTLGLSATHAPP